MLVRATKNLCLLGFQLGLENKWGVHLPRREVKYSSYWRRALRHIQILSTKDLCRGVFVKCSFFHSILLCDRYSAQWTVAVSSYMSTYRRCVWDCRFARDDSSPQRNLPKRVAPSKMCSPNYWLVYSLSYHFLSFWSWRVKWNTKGYVSSANWAVIRLKHGRWMGGRWNLPARSFFDHD